MTKKIKLLCEIAGFSAVGISKPEIITDEASFFSQWLTEGRNAGMEWLETTFSKRVNPFKIFPEIKSIISLAYIYNTPYYHKEDKDIPKISRYAWGNADYHKVMKKLLKNVCKDMISIAKDFSFKEIKTMYFVDTSPVMEKYWAVNSGVGARGKNTIVINPEFGSFFFIGTIFINIELEYDGKIKDLCKSCDLCLKSCPTGALYSEYRLDARKCISYHTIENKNDIPNEINLNNWIFGCDICQNVCPYNNKKDLIFSRTQRFSPKEKFFNKSREFYLNLTEKEFYREFKNTPVKRLKYKNWIRNLKSI